MTHLRRAALSHGLLLALLGLVWHGPLTGCSGPCEYRDVPGTCTITVIQDATELSDTCTVDATDTAVVLYTYVPSAGGDSDTGLRLRVGPGSGFDPPRAFLDAEDITVGSSHACVRREITQGTCSPRLYKFTAFDTEVAHTQYCEQ